VVPRGARTKISYLIYLNLNKVAIWGFWLPFEDVDLARYLWRIEVKSGTLLVNQQDPEYFCTSTTTHDHVKPLELSTLLQLAISVLCPSYSSLRLIK
jgi:hypothetical protein